MLDRLIESPLAAFGFIFFVLVLFAFYMVNRERAHVQRLKGPRRFQPKWTSRGDRRRSRRRRGRPGFKPEWSPRGSGADPPGTDPEPAADRDPDADDGASDPDPRDGADPPAPG